MEKGIAFPTCINVNQTVSNAALLPEDTRTLQEGDFVKM
jgi:methionine aminopeptidase